MTKKIGLFFGAGAEISYGMPLGGSFALDIFRQNTEPDKKLFQQQIKALNLNTNYARWLPDNCQDDSIWTFGKREFSALLESTLEYRRRELLSFLDTFDDHAEGCLNGWANMSSARFEEAVEELTGKAFGQYSYNHITLNDAFGTVHDKLFDSKFFAALLEIVNQHDFSLLRRTVMAFVQLLVAAHGKTLVDELNHRLFKKDGGLTFLEDMPKLFRLELSNIGRSSLELVLDAEPKTIDDSASPEEIITAFALRMLGGLLALCLDYRSLIDEHFRYLYSPNTQWAKFTKIAIFLFTVRRYIADKLTPNDRAVEDGPGYYHDLGKLAALGVELPAIGTSNYNTFIKNILAQSDLASTKLFQLNGGLHDFYDPYLNKIIELKDVQDAVAYERLLVPFMLTQSGTKPLTSIKMSERYVDLHRQLRACDSVAVVGFNFNIDDSHINGIFRALTDHNVPVKIFKFCENGSLSARDERDMKMRLRMERNDLVEILPVDAERKSDGKFWYERVAELG